MPRVPKPHPDLTIQSLSTGEIIRERTYWDDLDGQEKPMAEYYGPFKPPEDLPKHKMDRVMQVRAAQLNLLKDLRIVKDDRPKPPKPLPTNQRVIAGMLWTFPKRSWRRL